MVLNTNRYEQSKIKVIGEFGLGLISFRSVRRNLENSQILAFGIDANRLEVVSKGETNPLVLIQGFDAALEYENYHIEAYLNEVNRRVNFIIKK